MRRPGAAVGLHDALERSDRGGQEISKTGQGLIAYTPVLFGRESLLSAAVVLAIPPILLSVMVRLFPPWERA
jgi:hypothetical protein